MTVANASDSDQDRIPVLLYHSVSDAPDASITPFSTEVDEFAAHVGAIAESGRKAVTFGELAARLRDGDAGRLRELVCVTFDDGWADNLAAARVLVQAGLPATFFVTSGFVGRAGMLDDDGLRELAALPGVEIGAHSVSHPYLDELAPDELERELIESRQSLSEILGREVSTFAYPHGAHGPRVREATIAAGYAAAAAVKNAISHGSDDPFAVARWTVRAEHTLDDVRSIVAGSAGERAWEGERLRTAGYRAYRRLRRRLRGLARGGGVA